MFTHLADFTYTTTTSTGGSTHSVPVVVWLLLSIIVVVLIAAMWKTFTKAGKPGWAAIVPIYNMWVLAEVAGKPGWWGLLVLLSVVPFVGWIAALIVEVIIALGVARNFGKSDTFGIVGLFIFSFVGYPILGFGDAKYVGNQPAAPGTPQAQPPQVA